MALYEYCVQGDSPEGSELTARGPSKFNVRGVHGAHDVVEETCDVLPDVVPCDLKLVPTDDRFAMVAFGKLEHSPRRQIIASKPTLRTLRTLEVILAQS